MEYQLIFKEDDVKALVPFSKNIAGEYMGAAMFEAQEIGLKAIVGCGLLAALQQNEQATGADVDARLTIAKNKCLPYLVYETAVRLIPKVAYKVANIGSYQATDEKVQPLSKENNDAVIADYQANADHFCFALQNWLCENAANYPEMGAEHCCQLAANLRSAATCGIWLGGMRGFEL